jgi:hypothetical protein
MSFRTMTRGQQLLVLTGLLAVFAVVMYVEFWPKFTGAAATPPAGTAASPSNQAGSRGGRAGLPVSDVRLEALKHDGTDLAGVERNPFRFQVKAPPAPPPRPATTPPPQAFAPPPATGPPPPPPIPLKYVGVLGAAAQRVAVLSDSRGNPFYGREGDIIEGRYRVLRIAADSIDVAYADGRGRQTLRLSAQ